MAFSKLKNLKVFISNTAGDDPNDFHLEYDFIYINTADLTVWAVEFVQSRSTLMATKVARAITDFISMEQLAALDMAENPSGINPYITESARKAFISYTGFLSQANVSTNSGLLVVGKTYVIDTLVAGDNFANVGYTAEGVDFVATGTTPTAWANGTVVINQTNSAPTILMLENELPAPPPVWTRKTTGTYELTKTGAFVNNKTVPIDDIYTDVAGNLYKIARTSADVMTLLTYAAADTSVLADNVLSSRYINIEIYK